jgi:hypothetical protein
VNAAAVVASGSVGPGVMPPQVLGGTIWWYFVAVYLITFALALFALVDSMRPRRRERLSALREPWMLYPLGALVYLLLVLGVWIPAIPRAVSVAPVVTAPFALALGIAYLLRVVFPKAPPIIDE